MTDIGDYERALVAIGAKSAKILKESGLLPEDFSDPLAAAVWRAETRLHERGIVPDLLALTDALPQADPAKLADIVDGSMSTANSAFYVRKVLEASQARKAARIGRKLQEDAATDPGRAIIDAEIALASAKSAVVAAKSAEARPRFRLVSIEDLEVTAPQWHIRGILGKGEIAELFGESNAGKSFISIDLACSIASGRAFHGLEVVNPGPVVYLAAEGLGGLPRRFGAWLRYAGCPKPIPLRVSTSGAVLGDPLFMQDVAAALGQVRAEIGTPVLVVVDTWAGSLGGDENSTADTQAGIVAIRRLIEPLGASALIVHHTGHAEKGRARGSYALHASLDRAFIVERTEERIRLRPTKTRDGRSPAPMSFVLRDVYLGIQDEEGLPVYSAVLDRVEEGPDEGQPQPTPADRAILEALEQGPATASELASRLGRKAESIRASTSRLKKSNPPLLSKEGERWTLPHRAHRSAQCAPVQEGESAQSAPASLEAVRCALSPGTRDPDGLGIF